MSWNLRKRFKSIQLHSPWFLMGFVLLSWFVALFFWASIPSWLYWVHALSCTALWANTLYWTVFRMRAQFGDWGVLFGTSLATVVAISMTSPEVLQAAPEDDTRWMLGILFRVLAAPMLVLLSFGVSDRQLKRPKIRRRRA